MPDLSKQDIFNLMNKNQLAVISTSLDGNPEAALIGFGQTEDLEIIFGTYNTTRKYKNLKANPKVAFVIGWNMDFLNIQYQGIATELAKEDYSKFVPSYHDKVPAAARYASHPEQTYFLVKPTWIRYSDLSGEKEQITELNLS